MQKDVNSTWKKELKQWAALSWAIWNARNKVYFENIQTQPQVILEGANAVLEAYQRVSSMFKG